MIWETALSFAWRHWKLLGSALIAGILIATLLTARWDADDLRHQRDNLAQWQQTIRQDVSRAAGVKDAKGNPGLLPVDRVSAQIVYLGKSIDTLQSALDDKNRESEARAKAYADSKSADAQTIALMDARQKADASRLDTLQRLARDLPDNLQCRVPAALTAQLDGL